jgi:Family of unknown function (DUF5678)
MSVTAEISRSPLPAGAIEEYAGKWIAVRDGEIVASAENLDELVANEHVRSDDAVYQVPESGSYFY